MDLKTSEGLQPVALSAADAQHLADVVSMATRRLAESAAAFPSAPYDVLDRYSALAAGVSHRWERLTMEYLSRCDPFALFSAPLAVPGVPYPLARWQLQRLLDWAVIEPVGQTRWRADRARHFRVTPLGVAAATVASAPPAKRLAA